MRTIQFDHKDLDSVQEAIKEIGRQIDVSEKTGATMETPISVTIDLQNLRKSTDPQQRMLADVLSAINELKSYILRIDSNVTPLPSTSYSYPGVPPMTFSQLLLGNDADEKKKNDSLAALAGLLSGDIANKNETPAARLARILRHPKKGGK